MNSACNFCWLWCLLKRVSATPPVLHFFFIRQCNFSKLCSSHPPYMFKKIMTFVPHACVGVYSIFLLRMCSSSMLAGFSCTSQRFDRDDLVRSLSLSFHRFCMCVVNCFFFLGEVFQLLSKILGRVSFGRGASREARMSGSVRPDINLRMFGRGSPSLVLFSLHPNV